MFNKRIGMVIGALMFTMVSGTAVMASDDAAQIGLEDAVKTALEDAGIAESDAAVYKKVWKYSDGMEKYEVKFVVPGQMKYEYEVDAVSGKILKNEMEGWEADDSYEYSVLTPGKTDVPEELQKALDDAAQAAMKDAGVNPDDAYIYTSGKDLENGVEVYSVEFFLPGTTKYEYDIDIASGNIVNRSQDVWEAEDDLEYKGLMDPQAAKTAAATDAAAGAVTDAQATEIAVSDAGLSLGDVTVTQCYREFDDGIEKYDIKFYANGMEYDYDVEVSSGRIISRDIESAYDD